MNALVFERAREGCQLVYSRFSHCVLAEKATNPRNKYEDWEFIMAFCDQVNSQLEG